MKRNLKLGASSVGGVIGIIIVVLVLLLGAYYFWRFKIGPRINHSSFPTSTSTSGVVIGLSATTT